MHIDQITMALEEIRHAQPCTCTTMHIRNHQIVNAVSVTYLTMSIGTEYSSEPTAALQSTPTVQTSIDTNNERVEPQQGPAADDAHAEHVLLGRLL